MSPFEVAAGNDVVEIARKYPELVILGGIDKRVLAAGREAIDEHLKHIMPSMVKRGGYIPTCDHGVPDNVSYDSYMHYRRRVMEMDH
jgi:uroporphyrinogen-III decarboxylase